MIGNGISSMVKIHATQQKVLTASMLVRILHTIHCRRWKRSPNVMNGLMISLTRWDRLISSLDIRSMINHLRTGFTPRASGLIFFSRGGALAASYLLHRQEEDKFEPSPFSLAIFVNASLPYSKSRKSGVDMTHVFSHFGTNDFAWKCVVPSDDGSISSAQDKEIHDNALVRRWHPSHDANRILIPTVQIYGSQDAYLPQSELLRDLCDEEFRHVYKHHGGHEIPRAANVCRNIAGVILQTKSRAELQH
jgi:predicted esterase